MPNFYLDVNEPLEVEEHFIFFTSLPPFDKFKMIKQRLKVGDIAYKSFGTERKEVNDLMSSIKDGRWQEQTYNLYENYEKAAIVASGDLSLLEEREQKAVSTAMWGTWLKYGIPTFYYSDDLYLVYGVLKAFELMDKNLGPSKPLVRFKASTADSLVAVVAQFDLIDRVKGARLLEHFETLLNLFNATEEQLMEVHGIGKKIASQFIALLRKRYEKEK